MFQNCLNISAFWSRSRSTFVICYKSRTFQHPKQPQTIFLQECKRNLWKSFMVFITKTECIINWYHFCLRHQKSEIFNFATSYFVFCTHSRSFFRLSCRDPNAVQSRQRIVDILLQIMVGSVGFSVSIRSQKHTVSCNVVVSIHRRPEQQKCILPY